MGGSHGKSKASSNHTPAKFGQKKPSSTTSKPAAPQKKKPAVSSAPTYKAPVQSKPNTQNKKVTSPTPSVGKQDGGLLEWVNSITAKNGVRVKNFTTDWRDGKAICALAAGIRPGGLNYSQAVSSGTNIAKIKKGIAALEKAGCPMLVDAEDFGIESKSMMTYISDIRRRIN